MRQLFFGALRLSRLIIGWATALLVLILAVMAIDILKGRVDGDPFGLVALETIASYFVATAGVFWAMAAIFWGAGQYRDIRKLLKSIARKLPAKGAKGGLE